MSISFQCITGPDRAKERDRITIPFERISISSELLLGKAGADVVLDDHPAATCSRKHARLTLDDSTNEITLIDTGSSNGTFVNTQRVKSACLKNGDEVIFGGGQSILVGSCMKPEQLKHPMITIWKVEILEIHGTHSPEASECSSASDSDFAKEDMLEIKLLPSISNNPCQVSHAEGNIEARNIKVPIQNDSQLVWAPPCRGEKRDLESRRSTFAEGKKMNTLDPRSEYVYHTPIRFEPQVFDEIMPRTPYSVKVGSFITKKVKKVCVDESVWKWTQESPNPHEFGQFITLVVNANEISCIKYNTENRVLEQFQGVQTPYFLCIDINSPPLRVLPDVYLSELAKMRMEGLATNQLTLNVIFFFKKKSEIHSFVQALKENYVGGNMSERILDMTKISDLIN